LISYYLSEVQHGALWKNGVDHLDWHNNYCVNQKKNKQLWNSLRAMNLDEGKIEQYVNDVLFEEIDP
jgi:hypothetical protein